MSVVFSGSNLLLLLRDFDMVCVCHFIKRTALFLGTVTGTFQILIGVDRQSYSQVITNTAAKRLRMPQVEHFRSLFQSHFPVRSKSPARFILCAACGSVVLLYAARVFDYFVVIEIAFMDNQVHITETISRLDSEKVR